MTDVWCRQASDACQLCRHPLLSRPLYVFPCGHRFHQDCLAEEVTPLLSRRQRDTVAQLEVRPGAFSVVGLRLAIPGSRRSTLGKGIKGTLPPLTRAVVGVGGKWNSHLMFFAYN